MYHDFSESPKNTLHGKGFTLLTHKISDLSQDERTICDIDAILYGCMGTCTGKEEYLN